MKSRIARITLEEFKKLGGTSKFHVSGSLTTALAKHGKKKIYKVSPGMIYAWRK